MAELDWLTARPVAHRGLHDASHGIIENTASAFSAALARGYGIETDLQISADGEAMVHHDDALGRLTEGDARLADMSAAQIKAVRFKTSDARILTLGELCDLVAGRTTIFIELKSHFDGDTRVVRRTADILAAYKGPVAVMSFDPRLIQSVRMTAPAITRGIVAERNYSYGEWTGLPASMRLSMAWFLHIPRSQPQFIAYSVRDLPAMMPRLARNILGMPLLTWTVRTEKDRQSAARWADQIIFEGWQP